MTNKDRNRLLEAVNYYVDPGYDCEYSRAQLLQRLYDVVDDIVETALEKSEGSNYDAD